MSKKNEIIRKLKTSSNVNIIIRPLLFCVQTLSQGIMTSVSFFTPLSLTMVRLKHSNNYNINYFSIRNFSTKQNDLFDAKLMYITRQLHDFSNFI